MKTKPRQLLLAAALACFSGLTLAALAQTNSTPAPDPTAAPAVTSTSTTTTAGAKPDAQPAASAPAETVTPTPTAASTAPAPEQSTPTSSAAVQPPSAPSASPAPAAASAEAPTATSSSRAPEESAPEAAPATSEPPAAPNAPAAQHPPRHRSHGDNGRFAMFNDVELGRGETADTVVAIVGTATSAGTVSDSVVAVCGNVHVTGPVGNSVVAVCGNAYIDAKVREVVVVAGNLELGPHAEVMGDLVNIAGTTKRDPKAVVHGEAPQVGIGAGPLAFLESGGTYLRECVFKLRLLAFAPGLGFAWAIAAGFLVFYVLLALLFRGGIDKCVGTLETRPGASILAAILTLLLTPVLTMLLLITIVGIAVIPFLGIALLIASLFGKATMLAWLGRRITRLFGEGPMNHPAFGALIGGVIVLLLYTVPFVGFIVYKAFGILGLGVVVYTVLLSSKREKRVSAPVTPVAPAGGVMPTMGFAAAATVPAGGGGAVVAEEVVAPPAVVATPASALPRAGFWIRTGALVIDVILCAVVVGLCSDLLRALHVHNVLGFLLLVLAAYGAVMWKLKGTTIGGIVCGLKVVRADNRPIDWATAIVRALGCFVSLVVAGLGFIWVAIDDDKQSWHDKIAGTTVVFARGNVSLV